MKAIEVLNQVNEKIDELSALLLAAHLDSELKAERNVEPHKAVLEYLYSSLIQVGEGRGQFANY